MTTPGPGQFGPPPSDAYGPPNPPPAPPYGAPAQPPAPGYGGAPVPPPVPGYGDPVPPPQQQPFQYGQPPAPYSYVPAPPAPPARRGNPGAAIALGFVAVIASAVAYGYATKALHAQAPWGALVLALVVALPLGKIGGRSTALPVVGLVFSLLALFLGQFFLIYLVLHDAYPDATLKAVFIDHPNATFDIWKGDLNFKDFIFYLVAALEGFVLTRRFGNS